MWDILIPMYHDGIHKFGFKTCSTLPPSIRGVMSNSEDQIEGPPTAPHCENACTNADEP